jgi:alkylation response protein AidB-like acyl-CoA dehydrogenase
VDLNLNEEQKLIQGTARTFLERNAPRSLAREAEERKAPFDADLWSAAAGLGWTGMTISAEHGGQGHPFVDQAILLEEIGRALAPIPYRAVAADAVRLILLAGTPEQQSQLLPGLAAGTELVSVVLDESGRDDFPLSIQTRAEPAAGGYRLTGTKLFVPIASSVTTLLVPARLADSSIGVFAVDASAAGVSVRPIREMFEDESNFEVRFDGVEVPQDSLLGNATDGVNVLATWQQFATIALCAEMYGAMKRVLEMTVEYAQQRVQFGRPIGSFQAVQHLCVQMLEAVEGSEHITHEAAWLLSSGHPADREVAMAASWVAEALGVVAQNGHQVHGAIGFTLEHDMQLYSRKMRIAEGILGDPARRARQVLARAS